MSGDLKNPAKSLPLGTLAAVITGYIVYLVIPIFLASFVPGQILQTNAMIMRDVAKVGYLVTLGIWGATLSSALGALLGAPRTLQALARDRVVPHFVGKGFGPSDTPRIATGVTFFIAIAGVLLGDLNAIAPVLSMFFLTSYGVLNLIAGVEGLIGNPSWRPTFRTPWSLSLIGTSFCLASMFMINPGATIIAAFIISAFYYVMTKRGLNPRWPDLRRSILMFLARYSIYRLDKSEPDARSWRPNIFVLSGAPTQRLYLIQLADALTHGQGFLTVTSIIPKQSVVEERAENIKKTIKEFLRKRHIPALVEINMAESVISGAKELIRSYGLGPLEPNIFLLGETEKRENFIKFTELLRLIYQSKRNVVVVREGKVSEKKKTTTKQIHVWWGGKRQNAGLMLALGYMLQTSPEWKKSELILKTIVSSEEDREHAYENLRKFFAEGRLSATIKVLVGNPKEEIISTTIKRFSEGADLVFLGMRPPEPEESTEDYAAYYEEIIKRTRKFPPLALVLAAEDIKFSDIFR